MSEKPLTPEEQQAKEKTKAALKEAIAAVDSPGKAEQVVADLEARVGTATEVEVAQQMPTPADAKEAASAIQQSATTPHDEKAQHVITETAAQLAAADEQDEHVIATAVSEAVNPEAAAEAPELVEQRRWLRDALLKRLDPASGTDVRVFLAINQLPHTKWFNSLMYTFTKLMTGGYMWILGLAIYALSRRRRRERRYAVNALVETVPSLLIATTLVEYPIKHYVRRVRPFIHVVRAIVVGRKPGSFSFPSGHSAASFAGAFLLSRYYPKRAPVFYTIAALVGFSRIYVGAHYPGDVVSGGLFGTFFAFILRRVFSQMRKTLD
jgi:undecaprenyl-diphosphatase